MKKKEKLTSLESQQIVDMQKAYGTNNVISAIRFSKSASINDVAKMLLQHCGVRTVLSPSIKNILSDKSLAEKTWSPATFQIAIRLASATLSIEEEVKQLAAPLLKIVEAKIGQSKMTTAVTFAIIGSTRKYGVALAQRGIEVIPWNANIPEEQILNHYKEWLIFSSQKKWAEAEQILQKLGNSNSLTFSGIPQPVSIRLNKYFTAKTNKHPTEEENETLWNMLTYSEHTIEDILHAMSCVPSMGFSIQKVKKILTPDENEEDFEDEEDNDEDENFIPIDLRETNKQNQYYYEYSTYDENSPEDEEDDFDDDDDGYDDDDNDDDYDGDD